MTQLLAQTYPLPVPSGVVGRLAPSPTGLLHVGNAWAFLLAWLAARHEGGRVVLRMEDIDPDRARQSWADAICEDLHWLGLDWDFGPHAADATGLGPHSAPYEQSVRGAYYATAMTFLEQGGHCYPCFCTRKELRALAGAPHVDDIGAPYPGTCRHLSAQERERLTAAGRRPSLRLWCPEETLFHFDDAVLGPQEQSLRQCGGDFALRRSDGVVAYQLAVVVDDALMGVTQVVRGRDILPSTARQCYLQDLLGAPRPVYAHVPLMCDADGERLAKRHQSLSLRAVRQAGVSATALVGMLACMAHLRPTPAPCTPAALVTDFNWAHLPRQDVRLTPEYCRLLGGASA